MSSVDACPICARGKPLDIVTALDSGWLTMSELHHLHVHIFPKYPGDRFSGRPIDPREVIEPVYAPGEFTAVTADVQRCILERS